MGHCEEEPFFHFLRLVRADLGLYCSKEENNSENRYMKFQILYSVSAIFGMYVGLGQLYQNIKDQVFVEIMRELNTTGCYITLLVFVNITLALKRRAYSDLLLKLDEQEYNRKHYKVVRAHIETMSKVYYYSIQFGIIFWALNRVTWNYRCISEKYRNPNGSLVCANSLSNWLPRQLDSPAIDWLILTSSAYSVYYMPHLTAVVNIQLGCTYVTVVRLQHLMKMLAAVDYTSENVSLTKKKFVKCIDYYNETTEFYNLLIRYVRGKLNPVFSYSVILMVALLIHSIIVTFDAVLFLELWVWLAGPIIICVYGQNLENMSESLNYFLYGLPWYQMHPTLIKDYELFFARTQKPFQLSVPMGIDFNMAYLQKFMKFVYTAFMYLSRIRK